LLIRWLHIASTVIVVGTIFFLRLILLPALSILAPEQATQLMGRVMSRLRRPLQVTVLILASSGGFALYRASATGQPVGAPRYWWAMGGKIALSLLLMWSVKPIRRPVLTTGLALSALIIFISAYLNALQ
jgi:uncharacterized membrane protein